MTTSVFTPFLRRFTDEIELEREETIALYHHVRDKHLASIWAAPDIVERISNNIADIVGQLIEVPSYLPLATALDRCQRDIIALETTVVSFPDIQWDRALLSMREAADLRRFLRSKEYFLANDDRVYRELQTAIGNIAGGIIQNLPPLPANAGETFTVPLCDLIRNLGENVGAIIGVIVAEPLINSGLFTELQHRLYENVCAASGIALNTESRRALLMPDECDLPPKELVETYFAATPFLNLFLTPVPFSIPQETRFSGHWIVAPPGRGKTTLLHHMFLEDLHRDASIILMDSKGDLINPIRELKEIQDRLVIVEPDPDFPLALNPLDIPSSHITRTIGLIEYFFSSLLEAKLTAPQKTLFRHLLPAIVQCIPNPTLAIFRDIMEHGLEPYKQHFDNLPPITQQFFDGQFKTNKMYIDTRNQLVWRLDYLMTNPLLAAMFNSPKTKFDIGKQMDAGKIIIINNSKELLEEDGAELFGRFFIALILSAAQQRSNRRRDQKLPCFVYIDECHNVISKDERISTILDECRSQNIALILAHQRLSQIESDDVSSALQNCAIRMANSDDDAKALAPSLRTTTEFLQSLEIGQFALWTRDLRNQPALAINVPFTDLTKRPRLSADQRDTLRDRMRSDFCSTLSNQKPPRPVVFPESPPTPVAPPPDVSTHPDHGDAGEPAKKW